MGEPRRKLYSPERDISEGLDGGRLRIGKEVR
jgi:hypothetical protein